MKPSAYAAKLEKRAGRTLKRLKKRVKDRLPFLIGAALLFLYFYGMIINSVSRGIGATFAAPGTEAARSLWEFNPILNWFAVLTPTGLAVTAVCAVFIVLFSRKGYDTFSGYKYEKDKRGFHILRDGTHGTSGWLSRTDMENICDIGDAETVKSTILGKLTGSDEDDDPEYVGLKENSELNKNILTVGVSGTGKSRGVVKPFIMQAVRRNESMICVDPKGELYESMSGYLTDKGYMVKCLNLLDMEHSDSFNCFTAIGDSVDMASKVAHIIINNTKSIESTNPFWEDSEENLLTALILYVSHMSGPIENRSLGDVYKLLSADNFETLTRTIRSLTPDHPAYAPFGIFRLAREAIWGDIASGLGVRLNVFANPTVHEITRYDEIDLTLPGKKPCAYFCVIPDQDSSKAFLSTLFFQMLYDRLYEYARERGGRLPVPVNMVLDEFCNVGKFHNFVETISTARSRRINLLLFIQGLPSIYSLYGDKDGDSILTNCDTHIFLGCNDLKTAKFFSDKLGDVTIRVNNNQKPMTPLFSPVYSTTRPYSQTTSNTSRDLMMVDEVLRLPNEECLVSLRGRKPMRLFKIIPDELVGFNRLRSVSMADHIPEWKKRRPAVLVTGHSSAAREEPAQQENTQAPQVVGNRMTTPAQIK